MFSSHKYFCKCILTVPFKIKELEFKPNTTRAKRKVFIVGFLAKTFLYYIIPRKSR